MSAIFVNGTEYANGGGGGGGGSLFPGGTAGQVLTKQSATEGDADWETPSSGIPTGGTTGQVLTKKSGTDGDVGWTTPSNPDLSNYYTKSETITQIDNAIGAALLASY